MTQSGDMLDIQDIIDSLAIKLIGVVPDDRGITIATNKGEPIVLDNGALAGQAFRNIAKRITGEEVPIMDLRSKEQGFFKSFKKLFGLK